MRRPLPRLLAVAALGLFAAGPAAAQTLADAWLERLRAERLQAAESALARASVPSAPAAPVVSERNEGEAAATNLPAWRGRLTPEARGLLESILAAEDVPAELLAVGWVESRFDPQAVSPKGARGVWQLMPETARRYGLQVSGTRDERSDPARSTRAAARYLADLYEQFGDWLLALAAYNAGEQRVAEALARARRRDFWRLRFWLPRETQDYVPAVLGAMGKLPPPRARGGEAAMWRATTAPLGGAAQALD